MIETKQLKLIPCQLKHFEAILSDRQELELILGAIVPDNWTDFFDVIPDMYRSLLSDPSLLEWGAYLFIHREDNILIGWGGFKGKADARGIVEIGYEIIPLYRNRGLATEAAWGLIEYAFSYSHIKSIQAQTLAINNASTKLLQNIGMQFVGTTDDPNEGGIWHWYLSKENYKN
ncbi:GNAT family N-acetyltransferase [Candidatus Gracilibacteria bacterium]|nr:GNAT family N-acetyltransferase [Candidatus Gracilibacteria bacterium]NJM87637.1 GNAT family N-acetyltransferase [Hydrococcus sp. RU_2_2]NJP19218.1 GNAT family N-acetyltransferase [Hydrococcus sp. CRU_1_1]